MITIKEIAKICGVSPSTVSKVIKDYPTIPDDTKEKVKKVIDEYGYVPNSIASSLSSGDYRNIGILGFLNDKKSPLSRSLFGSILASFQAEMTKNSYDLVFIDKNVNGKQTTFLSDCEHKMVSGILLFGNLYDSQMQEVMNSKFPTIGFDYQSENVNSVYTDGRRALYNLTNYIIEQGHKNIVFVAGDMNSMTEKRIEGFLLAMNEHGFNASRNDILSISYGDAEEAERITDYIIENRPDVTAIIYPDDMCAIGGIHRLRELGKKVPKDISVAGFDGMPFAKYLTYPLTTMKQDSEAIGTALAKTLIEVMRHPTKEKKVVKFEAELIKGRTVAKIN